MIDWSDPDARFTLIQRVGVTEYIRRFKEHQARNASGIVNGHTIKQVQTRLGQVFAVAGADGAFATLDDAQAYACSLPPGTAKQPE
jgi:hypothetical protein